MPLAKLRIRWMPISPTFASSSEAGMGGGGTWVGSNALPFILDPGDQRLVLTLDFDCNFQATVRDAMHDNIGNCLFETKLNSKRKIG